MLYYMFLYIYVFLQLFRHSEDIIIEQHINSKINFCNFQILLLTTSPPRYLENNHFRTGDRLGGTLLFARKIKGNVVFNYFSENHHEFWDLGVQIARSPRTEGVRRCPIACWKATFMYFMEIKQTLKKSFSKIFFRSTKKLRKKSKKIFYRAYWSCY